MTYDLVIRNGRLVDGTGRPWLLPRDGLQRDGVTRWRHLLG